MQDNRKIRNIVLIPDISMTMLHQAVDISDPLHYIRKGRYLDSTVCRDLNVAVLALEPRYCIEIIGDN